MKTLSQLASGILFRKPHLTKVTYEVVPINCTLWEGGFVDEKGIVRGVANHQGKWRYSFEDVNHLKVYDLVAYPDCDVSDSDAIMNIYIDGEVVATGKSSACKHVHAKDK